MNEANTNPSPDEGLALALRDWQAKKHQVARLQSDLDAAKEGLPLVRKIYLKALAAAAAADLPQAPASPSPDLPVADPPPEKPAKGRRRKAADAAAEPTPPPNRVCRTCGRHGVDAWLTADEEGLLCHTCRGHEFLGNEHFRGERFAATGAFFRLPDGSVVMRAMRGMFGDWHQGGPRTKPEAVLVEDAASEKAGHSLVVGEVLDVGGGGLAVTFEATDDEPVAAPAATEMTLFGPVPKSEAPTPTHQSERV